MVVSISAPDDALRSWAKQFISYLLHATQLPKMSDTCDRLVFGPVGEFILTEDMKPSPISIAWLQKGKFISSILGILGCDDLSWNSMLQRFNKSPSSHIIRMLWRHVFQNDSSWKLLMSTAIKLLIHVKFDGQINARCPRFLQLIGDIRSCVCACACVYVCACMRMCVSACVRLTSHLHLSAYWRLRNLAVRWYNR